MALIASQAQAVGPAPWLGVCMAVRVEILALGFPCEAFEFPGVLNLKYSFV